MVMYYHIIAKTIKNVTCYEYDILDKNFIMDVYVLPFEFHQDILISGRHQRLKSLAIKMSDSTIGSIVKNENERLLKEKNNPIMRTRETILRSENLVKDVTNEFFKNQM
jgi:hypothetical protein